ncbi:unnamed protein product, partial [Symbiodinium sp. CCMP2592]
MSRLPRSATPDSRATRPAAPLPTPGDGGDVVMSSPPAFEHRMAQTADDDLCCLCMEPLSPRGRAAELVARFPTCAGHSMHLGCVAQLRSGAQGRSDLLCPFCRHSSCPVCDSAGWSGHHNAELHRLCHCPLLPPRRPSARPGESPRFVELPDRSMQWAPAPIRHSTGIAAWRPGWLCPRCGLDDIDVPPQAGDPCRQCGMTLRWTFDRFTGGGEIRCANGNGCGAGVWATPANMSALSEPATDQWRADPRRGAPFQRPGALGLGGLAPTTRACSAAVPATLNSHRWLRTCGAAGEAAALDAGSPTAALDIAAVDNPASDGEEAPLPADAALRPPPRQHVDPSPDAPQPPQPTQAEQRAVAGEAGLRCGLQQLDDIDLHDEMRRQVLTLQSAPHKVRGTLRIALRTGLREALEGAGPADTSRGWKLFFLAPRMLLQRGAGQPFVDASQLQQRCDLFRGEWLALLREATQTPSGPGSGMPAAGESACAARAVRLVQLGELSAAARALTAAPLAPGTEETLAELRDPERKPPEPTPMSQSRY